MEDESEKNKVYKYSIKSKIIVTAAIALFVVAGFILIRAYDPYFAKERGAHLECKFNTLTGLYCPSCGISRMLYEISHFNFINAIRNNAFFFFIFFPAVIYISIKYYLYFILEKDILPGIKINKWLIIAAALLFIIFTIVRNIPSEPFNFLAPLEYQAK